MSKLADKKPGPSRKQDGTRNTQNLIESELHAPTSPAPPVLAGQLLAGERISFVEFLNDERCETLCSLLFCQFGTSAGTMLAEFRKAADFPRYYCGSPGKLVENAETKRLLKKFARRAYRGDPDRRGVVFWERVAWLLWNAYAALMGLRARAEKIKQLEIKRIAKLPASRRKRAAYMRRYRAKRDSKERAKLARYVKPEAKQRWKERRLKKEALK
jgi:hypothetical protein